VNELFSVLNLICFGMYVMSSTEIGKYLLDFIPCTMMWFKRVLLTAFHSKYACEQNVVSNSVSILTDIAAV
jgi:hypothetical protein